MDVPRGTFLNHIRRNKWDEAELKACVTKYLDFFNNKRPHKYLNYLTPTKKEKLFYAQTQAE